MAKLYSDSSGQLIRLLKTPLEEAQFGDPPSFAEVLDFDEDTNVPAILGLDTDWNNHLLVAGVLLHSGLPVTINPPSSTFTDRRAITTLLQGLNNYLEITPSASQTVSAVKALIRLMKLVIRRVRTEL